jgi:hypothetical protein
MVRVGKGRVGKGKGEWVRAEQARAEQLRGGQGWSNVFDIELKFEFPLWDSIACYLIVVEPCEFGLN